jgi:hypothetical protein
VEAAGSKYDSGGKEIPITLPMQHLAGTGAAGIANGSQQMSLKESDEVEVQGLIASDLAGGLTLTAWTNALRIEDKVREGKKYECGPIDKNRRSHYVPDDAAFCSSTCGGQSSVIANSRAGRNSS